jgi:hypothetical protein
MLALRVMLVAAVPYAAWLVVAYHYHFIDGVNLLFHEAGHVFLRPFGLTLHVLGGTLLQLVMPLACAAHFARRGGTIEALLCVAWMGESLMYVAWYMADAQAMALPLVGGGEIHDWNWLLRKYGVLQHTQALSALTHGLASVIVIASLCTAVWLAFRTTHARRT